MKKKIFTIILFLIMTGFSQISAQTDLLAGWDFTDGWSKAGTGVTIDDHNSFTTSAGIGGVYISKMVVGIDYVVRIAGMTTTTLRVNQNSVPVIEVSGIFDTTVVLCRTSDLE